ncbi:LamG-like jellyroll fold domain-containing protein [Nonlabens ponticola]|uniref:Choice-of-anchor D domain-containing protein n=1 Tax=Nonlabens ponticola TaxID=2496866 RepID=A0A3S9MZG2_9FLAO|nr:LamG-like jellyroll fold domain-containing protein [Nonlabens ponticola]AZQ44453.1 choice-of-anchor D domain-containing protein [Nonlabens ponticola]
MKLITLQKFTIALLFLSLSLSGQTSYVEVEAFFENGDSFQAAQIFDSAGNVVLTVCDDANCYDGTTQNNYSIAGNIGCIANGTYTLRTYDRSPDGNWNGNSFFRIVVAGVEVVNRSHTSGTQTQDNTFSISGGGTQCAADINIQGAGNDIIDGDTTPSINDGTDHGNVTVSQTSTKTFIVQNTGTNDLNLNSGTPVQISGADAADFSITSLPASTISGGGNSTFEITYTARSTAPYTSNATVTIANNDPDEGSYSFNISGNTTRDLSNFPLTNIAYYNFETNLVGWTTAGTNLTWVVGRNAEKGEGDYAYTSNFNDYPSNSSAYLISPIISTVGFDNLELSLDFFTNTADAEDGMRVEYSPDGGASWFVLGSTTSGSNWYDTTTVTGISATANAWTGLSSTLDSSISRFETGKHELPATLENNPNVQIRVLFAANGSGNSDGVAVDNMIVSGRPLTYSAPLVGPANETSQLSLWLDASTLSAANGSKLTQWDDQAENNNAAETTANAPTYTDNVNDNVNFNPAVTFDRSQGQHMRGSGGFNSQDYWIVVRSTLDISNELADETLLLGSKYSVDNSSNDPSGLGWGTVSIRYDDEVLAHSIDPVSQSDVNTPSYGRAFTDASRRFDDVNIINVKTNAAGTQTELYINGRRVDNTTGQTTQSFEQLLFNEFTNTPYYLGVGRYTLTGLPFESHLDGQITEVISFRDSRSAAAQQKIFSYLAIKNGVSLHNPNSALTIDDHIANWDYVNSDNTVIWDASANTTHNYDVAAIGRDDVLGLEQKQSQSENSTSILSIGLVNVTDLGTQNSNAFLSDKQFLIWGHDNGSLAKSPADINHTVGTTISVPTQMTRINRSWKIHEVGSGDIEVAEVRVPTSAFASLGAISGDQERVLIIADDANFTSNVRTVFFKTDGIYERVKVDIDGVKYFTLGKADVVYSAQGLEFDGIDDYVEILGGNDISTSFTVSSWVKSTGSNNTNSVKTIVAKRNNADGFHFFIRNDNKLGVYWNNGTAQSLVSNTALSNNAWRHVAVTFNGSQVKLYIDGVLDRQANRTAPIVNSNIMSLGARKRAKNNIVNNFKGKLDEVRIWNQALTQDQLRYVMNQELEDNSSFVSGKIMPLDVTKDVIKTVDWNNLQAYYDMNTFIGTALNDHSLNKSHGQLAYEDEYTMTQQTAPLPYVTASSGSWEDSVNWENGNELFIPGTTRVINGNTVSIDWNIVQTRHDININSTDATLLGLFVESNELSVNNDHGLTVTHYLKLDGIIDLVGESQLVQTDLSDFDPTSSGTLERDQQGTYDKYNYNYWSSPVSYLNNSTINDGYDIETVMKDGTDVNNPVTLNFTPESQGDGAPASGSTAATISGRWLYKYANLTSGTYSNWQYVGKDGALNAAEGFTMKGTGSSADQNYVFVGKPNNGDIELDIFNGNDYLVGNPYPSAMDSHEFIMDNPDLDGTLYFWEHWGGNSHTLAEYQGGYAMYNLSGSTPNATMGTSSPLVNQGGVATKLPGRYIPVAQGFFVTGTRDGKINFANSQRVFEKESFGNSIFVSAPVSDNSNTAQMYQAQEDDRTKIRLGFNSPQGIHRQLLLTIDPNATMGYDRGYDGRLFENQIDDMAFLVDNSRVSIQGIPNSGESIELPLSVKMGDQGYMEIIIDHLENVSDDTELFLLDKKTNTYHNLREESYKSPFLYTGTYKDRFALTFKMPQTLSNDDITDNNAIKVYTPASNQFIVIESNNAQKIEYVELINMLGQRVMNMDTMNNTGRIEVPRAGLSSGTYVVKMNSGSDSQSTKVILR